MKQVVIVDDESEFVSMIRARLTKEQVPSKGFEDAKEALNYVKTHSKDIGLIVMDLLMPGMSGWVLVNEISKAGIKDIPIMVLTNLSHTDLPDDVDLDAEMIVKADISLKQLVERVRQKMEDPD